MLIWLDNLFLKLINKNRKNICKYCVWHGEEEMYKKPFKKNGKYCGYVRKYTSEYSSCHNFTEEMFEAKPNSTQTEEFEVNFDGQLDLDNKN